MTPGQSVRVRFAPSPTGDLHVGGLRTLLFNWLEARKTGGTLVLRVEDTDRVRSTRASEEAILREARLVGMDWDEGPDVGGPFAPYRQSERMAEYGKAVGFLREKNLLYPCFCTPDTITKKRELALKLGKTPHYDGTCAKLARPEADARIQAGEKAGLRFRVVPRAIPLHDLVKGEIEFGLGSVGDFLVTRAPEPGEEAAAGVGMPVYNFCCVIDDHLMGMTHVIRGDDHLANTARQLMIYEALDWKPPHFAHLPMVLGPDRQKLSKRTGDASVGDLLGKGYLPEAILNFLALLGWAPKEGGVQPSSGHPELFTLPELIKAFSVEGLHRAPAMFDGAKLDWMNAEWMRRLPIERILELSKPWFEKAGLPVSKEAIEAIRGESAHLSDLPEKARPLLSEALPAWGEEARSVASMPGFRTAIEALAAEMAALPALDAAAWKPLQKAAMERSKLKGKEFFAPVRVALLGSTSGIDLGLAAGLLGKDRAEKRLQEALHRTVPGEV